MIQLSAMQRDEIRLQVFDVALIILAIVMLFIGVATIPVNNVYVVVACTILSLITFPIRYALWRKSVSHYAIPKWLIPMACITYFLALALFIIGMWVSFLIPDGSLQYIIEALALACTAVYDRFEKRIENERDSCQETEMTT